MEKAHIQKSTDEIDAIIALQSAEPGTGRDLTADEQAVADSILDAEDGCVVLRATADNEGQGQPVWYLGDEEAPYTWDAISHTCWPAGATWPREAPADPREPQKLAVEQVGIDYACRSNDVDDDEEAADLAVSELLDDPAGWCRFVPAHWQPVAWVECYRTAYAAAWGR